MIIIGIIFSVISLISSAPYLRYVYYNVRKHAFFFVGGQIWNVIAQIIVSYMASTAKNTNLFEYKQDGSNMYLYGLLPLVLVLTSATFFVQIEILKIFSVLSKQMY